MTAPRTAPRSGARSHRASHARLLRDASATRLLAPRTGPVRLDAIVVPSTRPASALAGLIALAADAEIQLVVLVSEASALDQVEERIARHPGARGLVVHVGAGYTLPGLRWRSSVAEFGPANAGRRSDLSLKRNLGLLLARLHGWRKILFVDDDITLSRESVARTGALLERHQLAGMICREFPDNSVYCHARRLAGQRQDNFVSGGVLGVNCSDLPMPFFPDVYNEDWFFFGEAAARQQLAKSGEASQARYEPYEDPERARREEFGDLLAEGLYARVEDLGPGSTFREAARRADLSFWADCIEARQEDITQTVEQLRKFMERTSCSDDVFAAVKALEAALGQYASEAITPHRCAQFLEAWRDDAERWQRAYARANAMAGPADALARLGLHPADWRLR